MNDEGRKEPEASGEESSVHRSSFIVHHFPCPICGSMYDSAERAERCAAAPVEPDEIPPNTIVEVSEQDAATTGPGLVRRSFLLGLDDPRGPAHARIYRATFLWGRADFRAGELAVRGPGTEAEWRAEIERGP